MQKSHYKVSLDCPISHEPWCSCPNHIYHIPRTNGLDDGFGVFCAFSPIRLSSSKYIIDLDDGVLYSGDPEHGQLAPLYWLLPLYSSEAKISALGVVLIAKLPHSNVPERT